MRRARIRRVAAAAVAVGAVVAAGLTTASSNASWRDDEWVNAAVGTLDCSDPAGQVTSQARGRLLDGSLLPLDVDTVATVSGVTTTNDGDGPVPDPPESLRVGEDAFANPLDANALSLVDLPLTGTPLASVLALALQNQAGVVNQYAWAGDDGRALGASGVVNDSGVVMTNSGTDGEPPTLGTLSLSTLVESLTGQAVSDVASGVADVSLELGAVASRASVDGCEALWTGDASGVEREYAVAGLAANIDSPAVGGLTGVVDGTVADVEAVVNGLAGNSGVVDGITGAVGGLLDGVLGALSLGAVTLTGPTVDVDLTAVRELATATVADEEDTVQLDLGTGQVSIDLASLIGEAYGGEGFNGTQENGLNGLAPNTQLVLDAPVTNALVAALTEALDDWVQDVVAAVRSALYAADVDLDLRIVLGGSVLGINLDVARIDVDVSGTLAQLLSDDAVIDASLSLLGGECSLLNPVACAVEVLVNPLVSGITSALTAGAAPAVGGVLEGVLLGESSVVSTVGSTLSTATAPVINLLSQVLVGYLGVGGLVALRANVQNDPVSGSKTFHDWEAGPDEVPAGQYAVAALAATVLDVLGTSGNVNLELARGEIGPVGRAAR